MLLPANSGSSNYLADIDGDGRLDIANTYFGNGGNNYQGNVSWFKIVHTMNEIEFKRTMIDGNLYRSFDVNVMDVNCDFRKDVIVSTFRTPGIYWYEAPNKSENAWTKHTVTDTFEAADLYTGDINGDRKSDFVASGLFINKMSWFEQRRNRTGHWTKRH
jgi:hypothetical protein